jgi:hypothetical protein
MQILVGLWSRPKTVKSTTTAQTLAGLKSSLRATTERASTLGIRNGSGKISSVFIAPEFLFTSPTSLKAETTAISQDRRDWVLKKLEEYAGKDPGMLMMPGTIVFKQIPNAELRQKAIANLNNAIKPFSSVAPKKAIKPHETFEAHDKKMEAADYYKGQIAELEGWEKKGVLSSPMTMEHSFLIKNRTYVYFGGKRVFSYGKKTNMNDYFEDKEKGIYIPGKKAGVTNIGGLKIGIEVCLDHSVGMLKQHMSVGDLDIQMICSAEVPNMAGSCATRRGGYVLHASTEDKFTGVLKRPEKGIEMETIGEIGNVDIGGGKVRFFTIELPG